VLGLPVLAPRWGKSGLRLGCAWIGNIQQVSLSRQLSVVLPQDFDLVDDTSAAGDETDAKFLILIAENGDPALRCASSVELLLLSKVLR